MFRLISLLFLCLFQISILSAQSKWEIIDSHLDLGEVVADDQPQTARFILKNSGQQPILIRQVTPMSPIFKMHWDRSPILPGKTTEIKATFISSQLPSDSFSYKIIIYSNANNSRQELLLSGRLIENPQKPELLYKQNIDGLKFKSRHIGLGDLYSWQSITDTIYYINKQSKPVRLSIFQQPDYIKTLFLPEEVKEGEKGAILLTFDAAKKNDYGYSFESLQLIINGELDFSNNLNISSTISEDFSHLTPQELTEAPIAAFESIEYDFGLLKKGNKRDCYFKLTNTGKRELYIRKTKTTCGCTAVRLTNQMLRPGESTSIRIIFDSTGKSGYQNRAITVITNDPRNPEITLRIKGEIR